MLHEAWHLVKLVFKETHTNPDTKRYSWEKVAGSGSVAAYLYMCWYHLKDDSVFDASQFAIGLCTIIAAVCAGTAVKNATTPAVK